MLKKSMLFALVAFAGLGVCAPSFSMNNKINNFLKSLKKKDIWASIETNDIKRVKEILKDKKFDINKTFEEKDAGFIVAYKNYTPLLYAIQWVALKRCSQEIVKELLKEPKIDVNEEGGKDGSTPLYRACDNRLIDIVKWLLEHKNAIGDNDIDVNKALTAGSNKDMTALLRVCILGDIEILKLLLKNKNIDVNKDTNGVTPLLEACSNEYRIDFVKELLKNGAIIDENVFETVKDKPEFKKYVDLRRDFDISNLWDRNLADSDLIVFAKELKSSKLAKKLTYLGRAIENKCEKSRNCEKDCKIKMQI